MDLTRLADSTGLNSASCARIDRTGCAATGAVYNMPLMPARDMHSACLARYQYPRLLINRYDRHLAETARRLLALIRVRDWQ